MAAFCNASSCCSGTIKSSEMQAADGGMQAAAAAAVCQCCRSTAAFTIDTITSSCDNRCGGAGGIVASGRGSRPYSCINPSYHCLAMRVPWSCCGICPCCCSPDISCGGAGLPANSQARRARPTSARRNEKTYQVSAIASVPAVRVAIPSEMSYHFVAMMTSREGKK